MAKPNKFKDREQWMQLMPVIQGAIQQIAQYQAQGQTQLIEVTKKLLEETLLRFDERIDIEQFMPKVDPAQQQQQMMMQMMQQAQQPQSTQPT